MAGGNTLCVLRAWAVVAAMPHHSRLMKNKKKDFILKCQNIPLNGEKTAAARRGIKRWWGNERLPHPRKIGGLRVVVVPNPQAVFVRVVGAGLARKEPPPQRYTTITGAHCVINAIITATY